MSLIFDSHSVVGFQDLGALSEVDEHENVESNLYQPTVFNIPDHAKYTARRQYSVEFFECFIICEPKRNQYLTIRILKTLGRCLLDIVTPRTNGMPN